jgi:hypothetical protein
MKTLFFVSLVISSPLVGAPGPMLVRTYIEGLVPEYLQVSTRCEIYSDHVAVERQAGDIYVYASHKIRLQGDLGKRIDEAARGQVTDEMAPTDGPTTRYLAFQSGTGKEIPLLSLGSERRKNDAHAATTLVHLLDLNCGAARVP